MSLFDFACDQCRTTNQIALGQTSGPYECEGCGTRATLPAASATELQVVRRAASTTVTDGEPAEARVRGGRIKLTFIVVALSLAGLVTYVLAPQLRMIGYTLDQALADLNDPAREDAAVDWLVENADRVLPELEFRIDVIDEQIDELRRTHKSAFDEELETWRSYAEESVRMGYGYDTPGDIRFPSARLMQDARFHALQRARAELIMIYNALMDEDA